MREGLSIDPTASSDLAADGAIPAVYLVDDDPAMLRYVSSALGEAGYFVHAFSDVDAFLNVCTSEMRGCVILDVQMPSKSGPELQAVLAQRGVRAPVLFLTGASDVATAVAVMKRGAVDLIEKPVDGHVLVERVRRAMVSDAEMSVDQLNRAALLRRWQTLSPRERDVCRLIVGGHANKRVAAELSISDRTVEVHRARVMVKMNAANLPELVLNYAACKAIDGDRPPTWKAA